MEDNKLIAEFMGLKPYQDDRYGEMCPDPTAFNTHRHGLRYNVSWDWLMPVVEKIEDLGYDVWFQTRRKAPVLVTIWKGGDEIVSTRPSLGSTKINSVYTAVIEFINYYNLNQIVKI